MRRDALSGGSAEAGARDRGRAGLERHGECSLPRPRARGLARYGERASYRGLLWRASGEAETAFPAEAFPVEPDRDAETSFSGLEVRGGPSRALVVAGEGPTTYLLALIF